MITQAIASYIIGNVWNPTIASYIIYAYVSLFFIDYILWDELTTATYMKHVHVSIYFL